MPDPPPLSAAVVTRGFSPSQMTVSRITSQASNAPSLYKIPEPTALSPKIIYPEEHAMFVVSVSTSWGEESFKSWNREARNQLAAQPRTGRPAFRTASFNNRLVTQTCTSSRIADTGGSFESAMDCSAIDGDEEWEEEPAEETRNHSLEEKIQFKRIDPMATLPPRQSLITLMVKGRHGQRLGNIASQSPSTLRRRRATRNRAPPMPINEVPRTAAHPINATVNGIPDQAALSPCTTRRNTLADELKEEKRDQNASSWDQYFNNPFGCQVEVW
ncbi:hypothetical protein VTI74DRAFT_1101 [Chaetomium olivicolor]